MSTQIKNNEAKIVSNYLLSKLVEGEEILVADNSMLEEINNQYGCDISLDNLKGNVDAVGQLINGILTVNELNTSDYTSLINFIKSDFDKSKYSSLDKKELEQYIITYNNKDLNDKVVGENLLENKYERCAVNLLYLSKD
ncbi:hypothetical protein [Pseudotamlana agarivorans]|uniref:hypothetical protein n=1 Tax=Pseudotamlana agarivorans TaxID=481183 RepID=UPI000833AAB4|nr:hypothetical protein [Tamlana agarivorans]